MDMIKWRVHFIDRKGVSRCSCFEDDEQQARHFASLVNGEITLEINGRKVESNGCKVERGKK